MLEENGVFYPGELQIVFLSQIMSKICEIISDAPRKKSITPKEEFARGTLIIEFSYDIEI